jgi:hypothetical protein
MSRILALVSQSTVVSGQQAMQQLSPGNSEKASYTQVTVTLSHGLKQVMTLLLH